MASLPAQNLGRLFFPLLGIAVLTGALSGALNLALSLAPDEWSASDTPYVLMAAFVGALVSLPPAMGAAVAVAIQGRKRLPSSGNRQALVAALGAAVGATVPALAYISINSFEPNAATTLLTVMIFILVCSCIALGAFRGVLSIISKRQKQPAGS
ncbi:hypothetical protein ACIPUB_05015 [Paeniglutamicibacter sp. ORCA_105]|uniref:hypothetical protein n=1 Tax=Paeniglutamicibacter sp. ORCA_105 TaxID=3377336 RepID=UPI0038957002